MENTSSSIILPSAPKTGKVLCPCTSCKCTREPEDKYGDFCRGCASGVCGDYYLSKEEYDKFYPPKKAPDCPACGAGGMGDAFFDAGWVDEDPKRPGFQVDGRCMRCGMC